MCVGNDPIACELSVVDSEPVRDCSLTSTTSILVPSDASRIRATLVLAFPVASVDGSVGSSVEPSAVRDHGSPEQPSVQRALPQSPQRYLLDVLQLFEDDLDLVSPVVLQRMIGVLFRGGRRGIAEGDDRGDFIEQFAEGGTILRKALPTL